MAAQVTPAIAMAAGRDAANKNMRSEGRTAWSASDWNVAAEVAHKLMGAL